MRILSLDHLVLTVADVEATVAFFEQVLGLERIAFGDVRVALRFGAQKINLHQAAREYTPHALRPTPGSADLCFVIDAGLEAIIARLKRCGVALEEGPVARTGALGPVESIYFRDPDGNLIELARYPESV